MEIFIPLQKIIAMLYQPGLFKSLSRKRAFPKITYLAIPSSWFESGGLRCRRLPAILGASGPADSLVFLAGVGFGSPPNPSC